MRSRVLGCVLLVILGASGGCGSKSKEDLPQAYPVTGEVFRAGKLATMGTVQFVHQTEPTTKAVGEIGPDGKFTLNTITGSESRPGAVPGEYKAVLVFTASDPAFHPKTVFKVEPRENTFKVEVP